MSLIYYIVKFQIDKKENMNAQIHSGTPPCVIITIAVYFYKFNQCYLNGQMYFLKPIKTFGS